MLRIKAFGETPKMTMRAIMTSAFAALSFLSSNMPGFAADARRGERFAHHVCATCHVVSEGESPGNPDAPSFQSIAVSRQFGEKGIRWLWQKHPKMPELATTRAELEDVAAYLKSLAK
jgi:mono/diheme cytochrome c family protein